jgi:signal transduction histidine kinase
MPERALQAGREVARRKSELIATVSHELRTPLRLKHHHRPINALGGLALEPVIAWIGVVG